jgi:hypothetical protein
MSKMPQAVALMQVLVVIPNEANFLEVSIFA